MMDRSLVAKMFPDIIVENIYENLDALFKRTVFGRVPAWEPKAEALIRKMSGVKAKGFLIKISS